MEDYTYHFSQTGPMKVLGAHMLEVCASIAEAWPRLVFETLTGLAINVLIMDMGNRFRMLVNEVKVISTDAPLPKLPVARV